MNAETSARVLALLRKYGWNATSFQVLEPGFEYWFDGDDACVAYIDTGSAWVVAGAPIADGARLDDISARFAEHAHANQRRCVFFGVEQRMAAATAMHQLHIGEQAVWDATRWADTVARTASLRQQFNRARRKNVTVRALSPTELQPPDAPMRSAIEALIRRWSHARAMAPMSFLVRIQPFGRVEEHRYFIAERDGAIIGFLDAVPVFARGGWLIQNFLRDSAAPNGTTELLIDAAMCAAAAEDCRHVTLGLAPLAEVKGWLRTIRRLSRTLYDFGGLQSFKAKLRPSSWDPIYLAYPAAASANVALYDALVAFAGGSLFRFGGATLLRGPAVVVRLLAALLVPWTVMLALVSDAWFPSRTIHTAWVAFDTFLAVALFALAMRWKTWLGRALAVAITADTVLTIAQVVTYNAARARGVLQWTLVFLSIAAPAVAATVLWGAVGHHHRASSRAGSLPPATASA